MTVRTDVCISWETGNFRHQCQYHPGHKIPHRCPCGATASVDTGGLPYLTEMAIRQRVQETGQHEQ